MCAEQMTEWRAQSSRIPFFVAAPLTTVDVDTADGADIQIEQRSSEELTHFRGQRVAAEGIGVCRYAAWHLA